MVYKPIKDLTRLYTQLHQAAAASQFVFGLLDTAIAVKDPEAPRLLQAAKADIQFQNIHFNYGKEPVLSGINLTVVVDGDQVNPAMQRLHAAFFTAAGAQ